MNSLQLKRAIGNAWRLISAATPRAVILIYHAVGNSPLAVSKAKFSQQIDWLSSRAKFVSLPELQSAVTSDALRVCITFDDGYASVCDEAFPIMRSYGATATVYVNSGLIREEVRQPSNPELGHYPNEQFMRWSDVKSLADAQWTIGSHGVEHLDLTTESSEVVQQQVTQSKEQIESRLQLPCRHFAYTWGRHSPAVRQAIAKSGYETAVAGLHGPVTRNSDPLALPRIDIRGSYEISDFMSAVTGHWDYLQYIQRVRKR